jgi:protein phosphatase
MATTLTMAFVDWPRAHIVYAGDSRCYLLRGADLIQLTADQTVAAGLAATGALTEEEALRSPLRHQLATAVTAGAADVEPEVLGIQVQLGDTLLLCTDGVTEVVPDEELHRVLREAETAHAGARDVLRAVEARGGTDDATVIVVRFGLGGRRGR